MPESHCIFDLDGTLVDSLPGILSSLSASFERVGCRPVQSLTPDLVGPPLRDTLSLLSGNSEPELLDKLALEFKTHYDAEGFRLTKSFAGVDQMLQSLISAGIQLHIATNKRMLPTSHIVNLMGWEDVFEVVISPDSVNPALPSKAAILTNVCLKADITRRYCLYVGDRLDDYTSAIKAGIPFALAEWGYECDISGLPPDTVRLEVPDADQLALVIANSTIR